MSGSAMKARWIDESMIDVTGNRATVRREGLPSRTLDSSCGPGRRPQQGQDASRPYRSKLEAAYAQYLDALVHAGEIAAFWFEPVSFRLPGSKNRYCPDFLTLCGLGLTFIEVKGWSQSYDRSIVKLKTAAGLTPWARFQLVKRIKGEWEHKIVR